MLTPGDSHSFDIHTTTKFVTIKFNDIYIHSAVFGTENIQRLEFILQHANHQPSCILRNKTDKLLVKPMIEAIIREYINRHLYSKEIIAQLINTIIIEVHSQPDSERIHEFIVSICHYVKCCRNSAKLSPSPNPSFFRRR